MYRETVGWVYFVLADSESLVKIGYTLGDPNKRLTELRAMSPVPLTPLGVVRGDRCDEAILHVDFCDLHSHGEWFKMVPELKEYIAEHSLPWPGSPKRPRTLEERYPGAMQMSELKAGLERLLDSRVNVD